MNVYERFEHKGYVVEIIYDEMAENPIQESDDVVKVVMWHRRYAFGNCDDFQDPQDFEDYCKETKVHRLPLFMYEHSGITVSTGSFSCPWDSGQIGWVFVTDEDAKEYLNPDEDGSYDKVLQGTVAYLDDYLRGNCWGYQVIKRCRCCGSAGSDNVVDSCWGFIGDPDGDVKAEAMEAVPDPPDRKRYAI